MITPRAEERKALVALLESDDYDSADQLAAAIIKTVFEMLQARDLQVVVARQPGVLNTTLFGPYATEADAKRAAGKSWITAPDGEVRILELCSAADLALSDPVRDKSLCGTCGHGKGEHLFPKQHGKCMQGRGPRKTAVCECREFTT